jgi:hypothetical protein
MKPDPTPTLEDLQAMPGALPVPQFGEASNDPIASSIEQIIEQTRRDWMAVGALFQQGHAACETCRFCRVDVTHVPYGDFGAALPVDTECTLGDPRGTPADCPALQQHKAEQREEEELALELARGGLA